MSASLSHQRTQQSSCFLVCAYPEVPTLKSKPCPHEYCNHGWNRPILSPKDLSSSDVDLDAPAARILHPETLSFMHASTLPSCFVLPQQEGLRTVSTTMPLGFARFRFQGLVIGLPQICGSLWRQTCIVMTVVAVFSILQLDALNLACC